MDPNSEDMSYQDWRATLTPDELARLEVLQKDSNQWHMPDGIQPNIMEAYYAELFKDFYQWHPRVRDGL
ncbi:hypothetical protein JCM3774_002311 [Rhodotorula dairenensis]